MILLNKRLTYCKDHLTASVVAWSVFNYDDTDPILAQFSTEQTYSLKFGEHGEDQHINIFILCINASVNTVYGLTVVSVVY